MGSIFFHLIDRVHRLHDPVFEELEVAELDWVVDAVVLEVDVVSRLGKDLGPRHGVTVHVGDATVAGPLVECRRPRCKKK